MNWLEYILRSNRNPLAVITGAILLTALSPCVEPEPTTDLPCLIFLYGPPGSGKDFFSAMVCHEFDLPSIRPRDIFLLRSSENEDLENRGAPISGISPSKETVCARLCQRVLDPDCKQGALVEDIDLTPEQLTEISRILAPRFQCLGIFINANEDVLIQKSISRKFCTSCGTVYCFQDDVQKLCEDCHQELVTRHDDRPEIIRARFIDYMRRFSPAIDFFRKHLTLSEINAALDFHENENTVRCLVQLKTHLKASRNNKSMKRENKGSA